MALIVIRDIMDVIDIDIVVVQQDFGHCNFDDSPPPPAGWWGQKYQLGALFYRQQCHTPCKIQNGHQGGQDWLMESEKRPSPRFLGAPIKF